MSTIFFIKTNCTCLLFMWCSVSVRQSSQIMVINGLFNFGSNFYGYYDALAKVKINCRSLMDVNNIYFRTCWNYRFTGYSDYGVWTDSIRWWMCLADTLWWTFPNIGSCPTNECIHSYRELCKFKIIHIY